MCLEDFGILTIKAKVEPLKTQFKNPIKTVTSFFLMLTAMLFLGFGCNTSKPMPDPLVGWSVCVSQDPNKLDKAIKIDYQEFIQKLPPEEKNYVGGICLFEDGTGQHAVSIEVFANNDSTSWHYALIYDKDNKRIKVVKYGYSRHQS